MAYTTSTPADGEQLQRVDFTALRKKRFLIDLGDGNEDRILALNTSDVGVVNRLSDGYNKLIELDKAVVEFSTIIKDVNISEDDTDDKVQESLQSASDSLKKIDNQMRDIIDTIFDTNVCEVCCPYGSMYDPIDGRLRYEHIIDTLMNLYSESLSNEMAKTTQRIKSHTAKYTKKK